MNELVVLIESPLDQYAEAEMRRWWQYRCVKITLRGETYFSVGAPKRFRVAEGVKRLASFGVKARAAIRITSI